jgi:hypothetical protein
MVFPSIVEFFMEEMCILLKNYFDFAQVGNSCGEQTFPRDSN